MTSKECSQFRVGCKYFPIHSNENTPISPELIHCKVKCRKYFDNEVTHHAFAVWYLVRYPRHRRSTCHTHLPSLSALTTFHPTFHDSHTCLAWYTSCCTNSPSGDLGKFHWTLPCYMRYGRHSRTHGLPTTTFTTASETTVQLRSVSFPIQF